MSQSSNLNSMSEDSSMLSEHRMAGQKASVPEFGLAENLLNQPVLSDITNVCNASKSYLGYQNSSGIFHIYTNEETCCLHV